MSSIRTAPPQSYPAPSPHGDLELTGLRGGVARRPLTAFLVIVLGLSWLLFSIPVLAFRGVIPGANLPVEVLRWLDAVDLAANGFVGDLDHRRTGRCTRVVCAGVSLAVRRWLVVGGAVWPTGDRAVARLDLRRLVAHGGPRVDVDQTARLDSARRGGDQFVGRNGVGWVFPNPFGGPLPLRRGRRSDGIAVRGCARSAAAPG